MRLALCGRTCSCGRWFGEVESAQSGVDGAVYSSEDSQPGGAEYFEYVGGALSGNYGGYFCSGEDLPEKLPGVGGQSRPCTYSSSSAKAHPVGTSLRLAPLSQGAIRIENIKEHNQALACMFYGGLFFSGGRKNLRFWCAIGRGAVVISRRCKSGLGLAVLPSNCVLGKFGCVCETEFFFYMRAV